MTRRERIMTTINHREPDRVPIGFDMEGGLRNQLLKHYGVSDFLCLYEKTGIDCFSVWDWPSAHPRYTGPKRPHVENYDRTCAYGCWGKVGELVYPLAVETLDTYRWPKIEDFDFSDLASELKDIRERDMTCAAGHAGLGWLHHVQMRSYDHVFTDILDDTWMEDYMGRTREFYIEYFTYLFRFAEGKIDIIRADEDVGGQNQMLISPGLWRKWYKPLWKEIFDLAHRNGAKVWMHSCGYCRPLIPDFIEIGVDILNPLPPYVRDSEPEEMKKMYGDCLCFDGGVDQMNVLVRGTPAEVRREVILRIDQLKPGGGFIIGPSQVFSRDVPLENAVAFFEAALEYGSY